MPHASVLTKVRMTLHLFWPRVPTWRLHCETSGWTVSPCVSCTLCGGKGTGLGPRLLELDSHPGPTRYHMSQASNLTALGCRLLRSKTKALGLVRGFHPVHSGTTWSKQTPGSPAPESNGSSARSWAIGISSKFPPSLHFKLGCTLESPGTFNGH